MQGPSAYSGILAALARSVSDHRKESTFAEETLLNVRHKTCKMPQGRRLSPREYQVLEEMRGIGNWQYKEKLYKDAIDTYVLCLAYMSIIEPLGNERNYGHFTAKALARGMPNEYNEQAAILYLNIGQAFMMLQTRSDVGISPSAAALVRSA